MAPIGVTNLLNLLQIPNTPIARNILTQLDPKGFLAFRQVNRTFLKLWWDYLEGCLDTHKKTRVGTMLIKAAQEGNVEMVAALLAKGVDPDSTGRPKSPFRILH